MKKLNNKKIMIGMIVNTRNLVKNVKNNRD